MTKRPSISVIVATYNWPQALRAVLQGFSAQQYSDFELLVADDGSAESTRALIESLTPRLPYPLRHIWHEDQGFRLAAIRNKAAALARGDYLVFVDGDCVPTPWFLQQHYKLAEAGFFATGSRILLEEKFSRRVLERGLPIHSYSRLRWAGLWLSRSINRFSPLLILPDGDFRKRRAREWEGARGCNLAFWKRDYYHVNGFDESFVGWGREDSDMLVRLINAGVRRKEVKFAAPVLHLWHPEHDRGRFASNDKRLQQSIASLRVQAERGVSSYFKRARQKS